MTNANDGDSFDDTHQWLTACSWASSMIMVMENMTKMITMMVSVMMWWCDDGDVENWPMISCLQVGQLNDYGNDEYDDGGDNDGDDDDWWWWQMWWWWRWSWWWSSSSTDQWLAVCRSGTLSALVGSLNKPGGPTNTERRLWRLSGSKQERKFYKDQRGWTGNSAKNGLVVTFDILEPSAFRKYGMRWMF